MSDVKVMPGQIWKWGNSILLTYETDGVTHNFWIDEHDANEGALEGTELEKELAVEGIYLGSLDEIHEAMLEVAKMVV